MGELNKQLLEEDDFKDVTLVLDDHYKIKAHKCMLSLASDVLRNFIKINDDKDTAIAIPNATQNQVKALLSFIYLGYAELPDEDVEPFIELAKYFKLKGFRSVQDSSHQPQADCTNIEENVDLFDMTPDLNLQMDEYYNMYNNIYNEDGQGNSRQDNHSLLNYPGMSSILKLANNYSYRKMDENAQTIF